MARNHGRNSASIGGKSNKTFLFEATGSITSLELRLPVDIHAPVVDPAGSAIAPDPARRHAASAIIDTVAMISAISKTLCNALGLIPNGKTTVSDANGGTAEADLVVIALVLKGNAGSLHTIRQVAVLEGHDDLLIGVDMLFGAMLEVNGNDKTWRLRIRA